MIDDLRDGNHADKPCHLRTLADVARVALQLRREPAAALRQVGRDLDVLLERAQADLRQVLALAHAGELVGVPPNLARWPADEALAYIEQHLDLLVKVNRGEAHLRALQQRRPELYARAAVWLEVARHHYERSHPDGADPAERR
ncbi:hypothetical protein [Tepidimonas sp.]|uniref:hypothetical protein n=1 Tax=Tepidimonas sp. TaxID=2002775 RepID=UPI002FDFB0F6